ncbi:fatty acid alpha-hydroxylase [Recurvomyces mirabilis]|uniref:Ceramide very long chain fatty acid hydroxylase n=1 Tax=Recurvomyces mirabilis TaxID=574656 RepID=A0AAE0TQ65_9PEZI|nr:fatty acid alpha-hydroxylase [Recurvomyces mirabilis]KAK5161083.1 fatty acid alpha-hydroxylase [Recurvomyces mirabilis]
MPSRTLPTFPQADVASHNTDKSCYVTIGTKVYDVTDFLDSHPGGSDLILQYGGMDVKEAMEDPISHTHSEAAWDILDDSLVGFMATNKVIDAAMRSEDPFTVLPMEPTGKGMTELQKTNPGAYSDVNARAAATTAGPEAENPNKAVYESTGMSSAEDLSRETDARADYTRHKFLDLDRPLLMQVWNGGFSKQFYLEQVHRPRHYKGGASAPLFGNFLEPLSKTPWWVVPTIWLPAITYGTLLASQHLSLASTTGYWIFGLCFWTLIEYVLHRFLFHLDAWLPDNRAALTAHFLLHGIHHYLPMDRLRLVMPPTLFLALATPFWSFAHAVIFYNWHAAVAAYCGGVFGLPLWYRELKKYHMQHHFMDYENGFGVTSRFWDRVFGTELPPPPMPKVLKTT